MVVNAPGIVKPIRRALAEELADAIANAIAARALKPGERIVETALAEQLDVSRVPMREALKVLHAQGILSGGDHKGYRVVPFGPEQVRQVLEVRLDLECLLLRDALAAWRQGQADLSGLAAALEAMRRAATLGDLAEGLRADIAFHRAICDASGNGIAARLWQAIARHVLIIFSLERSNPASLKDIVQQHEDFFGFIGDERTRGSGQAALRDYLERHIFLFAEPYAARTETAAAQPERLPPQR